MTNIIPIIYKINNISTVTKAAPGTFFTEGARWRGLFFFLYD